MNSTSTTLDDHRLQGAGQSVKRLMLAFHDHRADRVSVGEFNFHWIDAAGFTACLHTMPADDRSPPNPGTFLFLNVRERINQSVHGRDSHLSAIAGTELVHGIAHMGFHRFHGDAEQTDGVVGEAAATAAATSSSRCELLHQRRQLRPWSGGSMLRISAG